MGRTDNTVKNYWNSKLKNRIQNMQKVYDQHFESKRKAKIIQIIEASKKCTGESEPVNHEELQKLGPPELEQ